MSLIKYDSNRIGTPDFLKGIAVFLMIQVHLMEFFAGQEIYDSLTGKISLFLGGPPAAPLFLAVMGYFIARSKRESIYFIKRGALLFIGGIFLNIGLSFNLLLHIYNGESYENAMHYIFGVDILLSAGMSMIFIALLKSLLNKHPLYPLALSFAAVVLGSVLPLFGDGDYNVSSFVNAFFYGGFTWSYFPLFPWLAYPLLGYSFFTLKNNPPFFIRLNKHIRMLIVIIWLLFIIISRSYVFEITSNLRVYYHHDILFYIWTVTFLAGFTFFASSVERYYGGNPVLIYLKWLGENVTAAYVFQWLIIGNITTEIYKTQNEIQLVLWFFGILLIVTSLIMFWNKNKDSAKKLLLF